MASAIAVPKQGAGLAPIGLDPLPERPLVSVLVANYNYGRYIGKATESVLSQTYTNWELLICDDGSNDDSVEVIQPYTDRDGRVRLFCKENGGMASAWNVAYCESKGEVLCLLDADDYFAPRKLETVVRKFVENPRSGLAIHRMMVVDGQGKAEQSIPFMTRFEAGWIAEDVVRRGGRWRDMPTSSLAFRRKLAGFVFPMPEQEFRRAADGYVFTLLPLLTEVTAIDRALSAYRVHGQNDLGSLGYDQRSAEIITHSIQSQIAAVNERLREWDGVEQTIDINRNLEYRQQQLVRALFAGEPRRVLLRDYQAVFRLLLRDDLYGSMQKILRLVVYGVAIGMPDRFRGTWLAGAFGYGRVKGLVSTLLRRRRR